MLPYLHKFRGAHLARDASPGVLREERPVTDLDPTDWLTPSQAARVLQLSAQRVRMLGAEGRLPFVRTPLGALFRREDVERFARVRAAHAVAEDARREG